MSRSATRFLVALCLMLVPALAGAGYFPDPAPTPTFATASGKPNLEGSSVGVSPGDEVAAWSVHRQAGTTNRWERKIIGHGTIDGAGEMPAFPVYGDDGATPDAVEGAVAGEEVVLTYHRASDGKQFIACVVGPGPGVAGRVLWQPGGAIDLSLVDFREGQRIPLRNGQWNLVSYGTLTGHHVGAVPANAQLKKADGTPAVAWGAPLASIGDAFPLKSIDGRYEVVYMADADGSRIYMPASPGTSTLTYIAPGYGYNIKMKPDNTSVLSWITFPGAPATGGESLDLQPGWTLAGFWDNQVYFEDGTDASGVLLPVSTTDNVALTSFGDLWSQGIGASYAQVTAFDAFDNNGVMIWDPANADFSTLRHAAPGNGYWINMYAAGTLRYPFSSAPMGVAAVAGDNAVTLSWKAVPGAVSYRIYWSNIPGVRKGSGASIAISGTGYTHPGLANGVPYYYVVTAMRAGDIESNESVEVTATPTSSFVAPTVSAMAPAEGYEGDLVFVDGAHFIPGNTAVGFGAVASTVASVTDNQIILIVPAGAASGPVSITTPGGTVATAPFTVKALPGIASVAPLRGAAGALVTITGTGFAPGAIVEFNGVVSAEATVVDNTRIQATVPAGATDGPVTVVSGGIIMVSASDFSVVAVTGVAPASGPVGSALVVTGTHFDAETRLYFANGTAADNVVVTVPGRIDARVPFGAASGPLRVETPGLSGVVLSPAAFTVIPPPAIASISPASGPEGAVVTLAGVNFTGLSEVRFGTAPATVSASTATQISAVVPAVSAGPLTVTVTAAGGSAGIGFTVVAPPSISGFTPATGTPGSLLTVTGSNFDNGARLFIGATPASIVSVTPGQIVARIPAGAVSGPVRVVSYGLEATGATDFVVKLPPVVSGFSPSAGVIGAAVTVTGANFDNAAVVRFNGRAATTRYLSATQLSADVPTAATDGRLSVATAAGIGFSADAFGVVAISGFTPAFGAAGTTVTFTGANFDNGAIVRFAGIPAATTFVSPTTLAAVVPDNATSGLPSVTTASGTTPAVTPFRVVSVTGFTPAVAAAGATVTLSGSFFDASTVVRFADGSAAVRTVPSSTQAVATVHDNAVAGPISVTVQGVTVSSAAAFTPALAPRGVTAIPGDGAVTLNWAPVAGASSYKVYWSTAPGVTKASPSYAAGVSSPWSHPSPVNGTTYYYVVTATTLGVESAISAEASARPVAIPPPPPTLDAPTPLNILLGKAGDVVHVYGTRFVPGGTTVLFNGTAASAVSLIDNNHLQATVPAGATSGPVTVRTAGGEVQTASPFRISTIAGSTPAAGKFGDTATITGTAFDNVVGISYGAATNPTYGTLSVSPDKTQISFAIHDTAVSGRIWVHQQRTDLKSGASLPLVQPTPSDLTFYPMPVVDSQSLAGDTLTLDGRNFDNTVTVTISGVSCTVTSASPTRIVATVPPAAVSGALDVVTRGGRQANGLTIVIPPRVASVTPLSGAAGATVTINGGGFDAGSVVKFGGNAVASITGRTATQITATVPAAAITGQLTVTTTEGGTATAADSFTVAPTITGYSPSIAPAGSVVTLTGSGFDNSTVVTFADNIIGSSTVVSAVRVDAVVPPTTTEGPIRLTTRGGSAQTADLFESFPTFTSVSPLSGAPGSQVTITGANLGSSPTRTTLVVFSPNIEATTVFQAYNRIVVTVPPGAVTGQLDFRMYRGAVETGSIIPLFTVYQAPAVSGFAPASGQVGDTVAINGSNFDNTSKVFFSGILAPVVGVTAGQIQAVVPPGAITGKVTVTTTGGSASSGASFVVVGAPTLTGFSPASGSVGAAVTINGSNFNVAGLAVRFNGVPSDNVTFVNDNQAIAVVPNAAATGPVTVSTSLGSASSAANFAVSASVASFSPPAGTFGSLVTITGTGFTPFTAVRFGGLPSPRVTLVNANQLSVQVPPGAVAGPITVSVGGDSVTTASPFLVVSALWPSTPSSGVVGTPVTIAGGWFDNTTAVTFGGVAAASVVPVDNGHVQAVVPPGAKTGKIGVTVQGVPAFTAFNFQVVPTIASIVNPRTGNATGAAGDNVVIGGSGFDPLSTVVTFNGAPAILLSAADNALVALVPSGATTGRIAVTTPGGSVTSPTDFAIAATVGSVTPSSGVRGTAVTVSGQSFDITSKVYFNGTAATTYFVSPQQLTAYVPDSATTGVVSVVSAAGTVSDSTFFAVPSISAISPFIGTAGTTLTVSGFNFDNATRVFIGGVEAAVTAVSPLQASATVPAVVAAGQVTVTTAGGTSAPSGGLFRYVSIGGVSPAAAPVGAEVTISGSYFAGGAGTTVAFNGIPASATVVNGTTVKAVVPPGAATGPVTVTTGGVTVAWASPFTVLPTAYDGRDYFKLRLGDYSQRTDNTARINFRKLVVDNLVAVEERKVPPFRDDESELFAIDNVSGNVLRVGKLVGNPRTLVTFTPPVVVGSAAMTVGQRFETTYTLANQATGASEVRTFVLTFDNVVSLTVPAGTFDNCIKLDWTEGAESGTVWLARGIGIIRETDTKGGSAARYIAAGGLAYGTAAAFNPGADNVSGVYAAESVTPEGGAPNYGFATDKTVNNIVHNPPSSTFAMTTYRVDGSTGPGSGGSLGGTLFAGTATDPQGIPVSFRGVHTPDALGYVGQWWYTADNSVKYPMAAMLFHAIEPAAGDEAIYRINNGSGGIRDNFFSGPLTHAGDNNAWLRDAHFGLRDAGVPVGFQEWFSVRNGDLFQLGNSVWPVYVPALKSLPKRFVLNEVYTTYNWLDNTVSRFTVGSVDNVAVPAGNFPLSLRLTQTDSLAGYPDKVRSSWLTAGIRGMIHVKGQDGGKIEELAWFRIDNVARGIYPANAPTIGAVSPGTARVGDPVTVSGWNFDNTAQLWFAGSPTPVLASIVSVSANAITATVPAGAANGPVAVIQGLYTSGSPTPFNVAPTLPVSVSVVPDNVSMPTGGSRLFTAYVFNATDNSVTWSVSEGSPAGGTFFDNGVNGVQYTAPSTPGTYHLVARSNQDNTAFGQATISVAFAGPTISFAGKVNDSAGLPLTGVRVEQAGNPSVNASTIGDGTFFLPGLPSGAPFHLRMSKGGYVDTYTTVYNTTSNISLTASPYALYTPDNVAAWGITDGKGFIRNRVVQSGNDNVNIGGVSITAQSAMHPSTPYPVLYWNGSSFASTGATNGSGLFLVKGLDNGDVVTLSGAKSGWTVQPRNYVAHDNATTQGKLFATPNLSVQVAPDNAVLPTLGSQSFTAFVSGASDNSVTWFVQEGSPAGGTFTAAGPNAVVYTAPSTQGTYHLVARSNQDNVTQGQATITVVVAGPTISYTGTVADASDLPLSGVRVEQSGNPSVSTTSLGDGSFVLPGLPAGVPFQLRLSRANYLDTFSPTHNSTTNIATTFNYVLYSSADVSTWGLTGGKGAIRTYVLDASKNPISGVALSAQSALHPATPYSVYYWNGVSHVPGGTTDDSGVFLVPNVDNLDNVTVSASKAGWSFGTRTYLVHDNSVTQGRVLGTPLSTVSVVVAPDNATLPTLGSQSFAAFVSGATDNSVNWFIQEGSPSGGTFFVNGFNSVQYTAPPNPGTYHLVARSNQDNTAQGQATITVAGAAGGAYSLSGTVAYGGPRTGRIYVNVGGNMGGGGSYGTSIPGPGPFTVRGLPPGSYSIKAFMDVADTATPNANNPSGFLDNVLLSSDVSGLVVGLADAGTLSPATPAWVNANPLDSGLLLFFDTPYFNGEEQARAYNVFWGADNSVGPGNNLGSALGIPARDDGHYFVSGLANSATYYVSVQGVAADNSVSALRTGGPVVIGPPTGLRTVSGTIAFPGVTPTGPLCVIVGDPSVSGPATKNAIVRIASPVSPQAYSVAGVQDGVRTIFAFIDMNNDGMVDLGDLKLETDFPFLVSGANLDNVNALIPGGNVTARVSTSHAEGWYAVELRVNEARRRPVKVTLSEAPPFLPVPVDFGLGGGGEYRFWSGDGSTPRPNIGDNYAFSLTYADNTTETVTASVTGVIDSFPTIVAPTGTVTGAGATVPTFSWTAPASPPSPYTYDVWVSPGFGGDIWNAGLPPGQLSVAYNFDGNARQPSLTSGMPYNWGVSVVDSNGNRGQAMAGFTPVDNTPAPVTYTGAVIDSASNPLAGVLAELAGNPSVNAVSIDNGTFVLGGIPSGVPFQIRFSKASYVDTYSQTMTISSNVNRTSSPYALYTADNVAAWGVTDGKGAIRTRVTQSGTDNVYIAGVSLTASSSLHPASPYPVLYWNGSSFASTGATNGSGLFLVKGLDNGDVVTVSGAKAGWTINNRNYIAHDNAVMQGKVFGSQNATVSVTVAPDNATLPTLGSQSFAAFVSGATDNSVYWSVLEGSPAGGTFTAAGPNGVVYTAPSTEGVYHLVARSNQDNNAMGQATITVVTETDHVTVSGHVYRTGAGTPVQGALVYTSLDNSVVSTDSTGYFFLQTTTPTGVGSYTIGINAPGYIPFSQFGGWGDHPADQTFFIDPSSSIGVFVGPDTVSLPAGGIQTFTAFVSGALDNSVNWFIQEGSPAGGNFFVNGFNSVQYTAPSNPGTYHLVARSNQDNAALGQATITVTGIAGGPYSLSGTVAYGGPQTGRIYLNVVGNTGGDSAYGTSIAGPGPFTIRGIPPGSYAIKAFMDVADTATANANNPNGFLDNVFVSSDTTGLVVVVSDRGPIAPATPAWVNANPADSGLLLFWDTPTEGDGGPEIARGYAIYWGTDNNVGPGSNEGSAYVLARDDAHYFVGGLPNGTPYYVAVRGVGADNSTSPLRTTGPVTVGAPTGLRTISGTISFPGVTPTGPLYVIVGEPSISGPASKVSIVRIDSPASPQAYSVSGVPDGVRSLYAFIDMNNDRVVDLGDVKTDNDTPFMVAGSNLDNVNAVVPAGNVSASVPTTHGNGWYAVEPRVREARKRPVRVTLVGAPSFIAVPIDIGIGDWNEYRFWFGDGTTPRPNIGDNYVFSLAYADNTTETVTATVNGVVDDFPTILSPVGTITGAGAEATIPTFSWAAPASPPSPYSYRMWVSREFGGNVWELGMPPGQTSVVFNADGNAEQPALTSGTPYNWGIAVQDANGNRGQAYAAFTPVDTTPPPAIDWTGINVDSGPVGAVVVLAGTGFDNSAVVSFNGVTAANVSVTPTQIVTTVPAGASTGLLMLQVGAWSSGTNGPTFTVTATPVPSLVVLVKPGNVSLQPGQPYVFTWEVRNVSDGTLAASQGVTWSAREGGQAGTWGMQTNVLNYTAGSTPGEYHLVARSTADNNAYGLAFVDVGTSAPPQTAFTVNGTLSYAGPKKGRIYVNLEWAGGGFTGYGISMGAAGAFSIRGVPPGNYAVRAWMDNGATGVPNAANPSGLSSGFTVGSTNVGGVTVTLADPAPTSAVAPGGIVANPGTGGALVFWDTPTDNTGLEIARSYNLYWGADNSVGPGSYLGRKQGIAARDDAHYFVGGLADNAVRWFAVTAVGTDNVESARAVSGPVTIGAPAGGRTVSGTISFPGATPTGPLVLVVGAADKAAPSRIRIISNPTNPQPYSVAGVPDGFHDLFAFIDMNNDNVVSTGDVKLANDNPTFLVAGANVDNVNLTLPTGSTLTTARTAASSLGGYDVNLQLDGVRKMANRVTLIAAPAGVPVPIDIGLNERGTYELRLGSMSPPNAGDGYLFSVRFTDNTSELISAAVTGVLDSFATAVAPVGATSGAGADTPTFSWLAPAGMPADYRCKVWVSPGGGGPWLWESGLLPSGTTSIAYDVDGSADQPTLSPGTYEWTVSVRDPDGNEARTFTTFTVSP